MRNGKLNKTEIKTLYRAMDILDKWSDWQENHDSNVHPDTVLEAMQGRACLQSVACGYFMAYGD